MRGASLIVSLTGLVFLSPNAVRGQAPAKLEFEAASIRAASPPSRTADPFTLAMGGIARMSGGPGTADPERLTISNMPLRNLLFNAYGVRPDQILGPNWLDTEKFDVTAKIAPGTTKEQSNAMLQNLLIERFKITLHHTTKEDTQAYELTVAKNGSKLKEVTPGPNATTPQPGEFLSRRMDLDASGFPVMPEGEIGIVAIPKDGLYRMTCRACSIAELVERIKVDLAVPVGSPVSSAVAGRVADKTGLTGKYDFHLEYLGGGFVGGALQSPSLDGQAGPGPDLFAALEKQLGLKLAKAKAPLDVLVIDQIDKIPADN